MQAYSNELWLGVWLLILPFLGFPGSWKERLVALTGLAVIGVALYRQYRGSETQWENQNPPSSRSLPQTTAGHLLYPPAGGKEEQEAAVPH